MARRNFLGRAAPFGPWKTSARKSGKSAPVKLPRATRKCKKIVKTQLEDFWIWFWRWIWNFRHFSGFLFILMFILVPGRFQMSFLTRRIFKDFNLQVNSTGFLPEKRQFEEFSSARLRIFYSFSSDILPKAELMHMHCSLFHFSSIKSWQVLGWFWARAWQDLGRVCGGFG